MIQQHRVRTVPAEITLIKSNLIEKALPEVGLNVREFCAYDELVIRCSGLHVT